MKHLRYAQLFCVEEFSSCVPLLGSFLQVSMKGKLPGNEVGGGKEQNRNQNLKGGLSASQGTSSGFLFNLFSVPEM